MTWHSVRHLQFKCMFLQRSISVILYISKSLRVQNKIVFSIKKYNMYTEVSAGVGTIAF